MKARSKKRIRKSPDTVVQRFRKAKRHDQASVAYHGREFSEIEQAAAGYLGYRAEPKHRRFVEGAKARLAECVIRAVEKQDSGPLAQLAMFVETWKPGCPPVDSDPLRCYLAMFRDFRDGDGRGLWTLAHLAARVKRMGITISDERLRTLAKEVGFPLKPDRLGRPRKSPTREGVSGRPIS